MKSINFTCFKEKLLSGEKKQTIRCLFIPHYEEGEIVQIKFEKEPLFKAMITQIYPRKLRDITDYEAISDGFKDKKDCLLKIMEMNKINSVFRYCFIIHFRRVEF